MARWPTSLKPLLERICVQLEALGNASGGVIEGPPGPKGDKGDPGEDGRDGIDGTPGHDGSAGGLGPKGDPGERGEQGLPGTDGIAGSDGAPGADGPSAYEVAVANGFVGNAAQWLASLVGAKGDKGDRGDVGLTGPSGSNGAAGSDGNDGVDGASAYQVAVSQGFGGTITQWLASLVGAKGDKGDTGAQGQTGPAGPGWTWVKLGADGGSNSNPNSPTNSALTFTAAANTTYIILLFGSFTSAATTTGIGLQLDIPSGTVFGLAMHHAATTQTLTGHEQVADAATPQATSGVRAASTQTPIQAGWIVEIGAGGGTVTLQYKSEVSSSAVVLKKPSALGYMAI